MSEQNTTTQQAPRPDQSTSNEGADRSTGEQKKENTTGDGSSESKDSPTSTAEPSEQQKKHEAKGEEGIQSPTNAERSASDERAAPDNFQGRSGAHPDQQAPQDITLPPSDSSSEDGETDDSGYGSGSDPESSSGRSADSQSQDSGYDTDADSSSEGNEDSTDHEGSESSTDHEDSDDGSSDSYADPHQPFSFPITMPAWIRQEFYNPAEGWDLDPFIASNEALFTILLHGNSPSHIHDQVLEVIMDRFDEHMRTFEGLEMLLDNQEESRRLADRMMEFLFWGGRPNAVRPSGASTTALLSTLLFNSDRHQSHMIQSLIDRVEDHVQIFDGIGLLQVSGVAGRRVFQEMVDRNLRGRLRFVDDEGRPCTYTELQRRRSAQNSSEDEIVERMFAVLEVEDMYSRDVAEGTAERSRHQCRR